MKQVFKNKNTNKIIILNLALPIRNYIQLKEGKF